MSNFLTHPLPEKTRCAYRLRNAAKSRFMDKHDHDTIKQIRSDTKTFKEQIRLLRESSSLDLMQSSEAPAGVNRFKCGSKTTEKSAALRVRPSPRKAELEVANEMLMIKGCGGGVRAKKDNDINKISTTKQNGDSASSLFRKVKL